MREFLEFMKKDLDNIEDISLSKLKSNDTAVIIIDMVKGFYDVGPLSNPYVKNIIPNIIKLYNNTKDYKKIFFIDSHNENSREFSSYPKHCIKGTTESELIDELIESDVLKSKNSIFIKKNSTNGFHCEQMKKLLDDKTLKNFIVVGVCSDICVKNFVISAVTYFNQNNLEKEIVVPINMVETYDAPYHNREFWNLTSLFEMKANGVKLVKNIK
ncbi:MAG: cysteine hydrolase family protein [Sarcina sp.]